MADGTALSNRGARPLDPARVAAVRETLDPTADFAEQARRSLADLTARLHDLIQDGDLAPCRDGLERIRGHLAALPPAALSPRGWFDSRARRLKRFRHAFQKAHDDAVRIHADLDRRHGEASRRNGELIALWNEIRDAVGGLDAQIAAGRDWLAARPADDRFSSFGRRLDELDEALLAAVRRLPLALAAQNADLAARDHMRAAADALSAWRLDWARALGMTDRKRRKLAPAQAALSEQRDALTASLTKADPALASACARRAEIAARLQRLA